MPLCVRAGQRDRESDSGRRLKLRVLIPVNKTRKADLRVPVKPPARCKHSAAHRAVGEVTEEAEQRESRQREVGEGRRPPPQGRAAGRSGHRGAQTDERASAEMCPRVPAQEDWEGGPGQEARFQCQGRCL